MRPGGIFKRVAAVPLSARFLGSAVSKADLLEAAWHLASLACEGGVDDAGATFARLLEELNLARASKGRGALRATKIRTCGVCKGRGPGGVCKPCSGTGRRW